MRKLLHLSALLTLSVTLGVTACGDDDDTTSNVGGTSTGGSTSHAGTSNFGGAIELPLAGAPASSEGGAPSSFGGTSAGGSNNAGAANEAGGANEGGAGGAAEEAAAASLTDAQILDVLDALNGGEIEEAFAVSPNLMVNKVEAFAQKMINDHTAGRQAVVAAAKSLSLSPEPSDLQQQLKNESEDVVNMFQHESAATLDADYMDREVSDHEHALALLDALGAAADAPMLKELIVTQHATVQAHYNQAVAIQGSL